MKTPGHSRRRRDRHRRGSTGCAAAPRAADRRPWRPPDHDRVGGGAGQTAASRKQSCHSHRPCDAAIVGCSTIRRSPSSGHSGRTSMPRVHGHGPRLSRPGCPGWDSNPHWTVFETTASAVGIPGPGRAQRYPKPAAQTRTWVKPINPLQLHHMMPSGHGRNAMWKPWELVHAQQRAGRGERPCGGDGAQPAARGARRGRAVRRPSGRGSSGAGRPARLTRGRPARARPHPGACGPHRPGTSRAPTRAASLCAVTEPATPPRRVVIAEDEALIRLDLAEMLGEEGYDVVGQAGDGEQAVELAEELRPDLVILDVKMPVLDGIAAAERIAAQRIAPVVILTAFSPARPGRAGPRRRRDGLPGQAVHQERPGAGDRDGGVPVRRDRRCSSRRSPTSPSGWRPARPWTGPRACCRSSWA